MTLTEAELATVAAAFADRFMAETGIELGWRDNVIEEFRIRPSSRLIRFIFRGTELRRPWDGSADSATAAALSCVDELVAHWHSIRTKQLQRWDAPPGEHHRLGCRCEERQRLVGVDAGEYLPHLKQLQVEGTETEGRASFVCTLIGQRWIYTWGGGEYVLEPYGDPAPEAVLSGDSSSS